MSSSSIPVTNVVPNLIVVSNDDLDLTNAPLAVKLAGGVGKVQSVELSNYCYEEVRVIAEHIVDPTFWSRHVQSSRMESLLASIRALAFEYCNEIIAFTSSAECNLSDSSIENAIEDESSRKVVKQVF